MALLRPLWMQGDINSSVGDIEYPLGQDRLGLLGSVFSRTGVLDYLANHLKVSQRGAGANASVDVAIGRCVIAAGDGGMYLCTNTSVVNVSGITTSRAYRIIARVRDKQAFGEAVSDWRIEAISNAGTSIPATPVRAISLATFTTSGSSTVTDAMINDTRTRATVGTQGLTGTWGLNGFANVWDDSDPTRPLTWMKTSDNWVILSGWVDRRVESSNVVANDVWYWDRSRNWGNASAAPVLPPEIRPDGVRDFVGITSSGDIHHVLFPNGSWAWRFQYNTLLSHLEGNRTWVSFDGLMYRTSAR